MTGQTLPPREQLLSRLNVDLIGPRHTEERLEVRPSDVYLTGILWPRNTAIAPEEDERLAVAEGGDEQGEDAGDQAQPQSVQMRRPSTAGVSFAAASESRPQVEVLVRFATYQPVKGEHRTLWARVPHATEPFVLDLTEPMANKEFGEGVLQGLRLNLRAVPFARGTLATVTLVNDTVPEERGRQPTEACTLFQVEIEVRPYGDTRLISRPSRREPVDEEDWSSALLYRDAREFAAGHTCSADWTADPENQEHVLSVCSRWIPEAVVPAVSPEGHSVFDDLRSGVVSPLSAAWLAQASDVQLGESLGKLCASYARWIELQETASRTLSTEYTAAAQRHIQEAQSVLARMQGGISFLTASPEAAEAFRLANLAMTTQREWAGEGALRWRPFQLGFLLLALESAAKGDHPDRNTMDLLWFPTGGGKTEAYLGLVAFVSFFRRLSFSNPDDGAGVATIMRYTLRLLTTQQFIRASAMICACEAIRRGVLGTSTSNLGAVPFSIGLWVGDNAAPNTRKSAFDSHADRSGSSPMQLTSCPCCQQKLRWKQKRPADAFEIFCVDEGCLISGDVPLPVWTVDDDVYAKRPTLLIGTVDKFAQIVRKPETALIMGVGAPAQPQLILQDELHLISGPLGTLTGLYETALDTILSANGTRPKIIGSTATIRRAREQVLALFDRETCQFPPPGLSADDSGFTVLDPDLPGRRYAGVTTAGRSAKFTLQAVSASLLQSAFAGVPDAEKDYYWTLVAYFNSLRELGGALVLMQDDVHDTIRLLANDRGENIRLLREVSELTSRRSQTEIRDMLEQLERPAGDPASLDVVLATNMVSVGVDIERLGLMLVNGQPKTMAEYIQSTSRVGRGNVPGLVVPILNNAKPRDRSHYETFRTWHDTLYREVEATSVTPFASRARDRALHAILVAVVRHLAPGMLGSPVLNDNARQRAADLIRTIGERVGRIDPFEKDVESELTERLARWARRAPQQYWNRYSKDSLLQGAEEAATKRAAGRAIGAAWPTPNSMRGVEPATHYRLAERLKKRATDGEE